MIKFKHIIFMFLLGALLLGTGMYLRAEKKAVPNPTAITTVQKAELGTTIHELETLFILMQERISLMHDLSRYKWNEKLSLEVLDQEKLLFKNASPELQNFIDAQNNAATKVQEQDFALFRKQEVEKFESVKDFKSEILPELQAINQKMILTIEELLTHTQNEQLPSFLKDISFNSFKNEGIERSVYDIAVEPLFSHDDA